MITSLSNSRVKQLILFGKKAKERKSADIFLAEGLKMFEEAPETLIQEIYVSETFLNENGRNEKLNELSYEVLSDEVFKKVSDTVTPQGILMVLKRLHYHWGDYLEGSPLFLFLEDIQDPGNLGTILRTAEGAGVTGVFLSQDTVDIYNPKTVRATMGSIFRVPFFEAEDFQKTICAVKKEGITMYATWLSDSIEYFKGNYINGCAFLIGNEGNGLKKDTVKLADTCVRIPMDGKLESLNAGIATGIVLYEAVRQRRGKI